MTFIHLILTEGSFDVLSFFQFEFVGGLVFIYWHILAGYFYHHKRADDEMFESDHDWQNRYTGIPRLSVEPLLGRAMNR